MKLNACHLIINCIYYSKHQHEIISKLNYSKFETLITSLNPQPDICD